MAAREYVSLHIAFKTISTELMLARRFREFEFARTHTQFAFLQLNVHAVFLIQSEMLTRSFVPEADFRHA
jgi:hypothetical protein